MCFCARTVRNWMVVVSTLANRMQGKDFSVLHHRYSFLLMYVCMRVFLFIYCLCYKPSIVKNTPMLIYTDTGVVQKWKHDISFAYRHSWFGGSTIKRLGLNSSHGVDSVFFSVHRTGGARDVFGSNCSKETIWTLLEYTWDCFLKKSYVRLM